jgi:hypothetical protein
MIFERKSIYLESQVPLVSLCPLVKKFEVESPNWVIGKHTNDVTWTLAVQKGSDGFGKYTAALDNTYNPCRGLRFRSTGIPGNSHR